MLLRFNSYAAAESWDDLVHAFAGSLKNSSLDEMILLLHTTISGPHEKRSEHIRPVSYGRLGDVPKLVMSSGDHEEEINDPRINAAKVIQDAYRRRLEWKRAGAAQKIQAAYRRHLKRKSTVRKRIDATQAYWDLLRKKSMEMEWPKDSRYYLLFRVPLAYILVCLDIIGAFADSGKKEANKRMKTARNKDLEKLDETRKQYMYDSVDSTLYKGSNKYSRTLFRTTVELQKKLSPTSKYHGRQSVSDLQRAVLEVKAVVESLENIPESAATRSKIQKRWDQGWKWIFEKQRSRAKGKKPEKPKLVLDEDLQYLHSVTGQTG